jgi:two-component system cell cycle sensor histidine kinase/response regulator CckA
MTHSILGPFEGAGNAVATLLGDAPQAGSGFPGMFGVIELFKFEDFYEISLGISVVLLFAAIAWSTLLRRKVREQAERIRTQFERENALQKRYQDLFENANDVILSLDPAKFILTLNHTGEVLLGCPRERARTMTFSTFLDEKQNAAFDLWLANCAKGDGAPFDTVVTGSQGKRSALELVGRPVFADDKLQSVEVIARDVTSRRQAEDALRQSEERFSSAFRASPVAIAITSFPEGRLADVNDSFVKLFGYDRREVIGRTATELGLWSDAAEKTQIENALRENKSVGGVECRFKVKAGDRRRALVFMEKITTGDITSILWLSHDMTDRLNLEAQVRQLLKMEAVGRLAAGVAHDFNNLLTVIQGNILIVLKKHVAEGSSLAHSLNNVNEAAQRAANLTRQLLTFSRKNNVSLMPLNLNMAVTNSTRMFKHLLRVDIRLRINFAPYLPAIMADATMLEQVLMNLVVNARDAMPQGGELTMNSRVLTVDDTYVERHAEAVPGEYVCLEVADTGVGMDSATLARIFEPFFTTKPDGQGTGLGLATVYGIVKQHKGWVEVTSEVGVGTTFRVLLPADRVAKLAPMAAPDLEPTGGSILLLEDEPAVLDLMGQILTDQGFRVLRATSGLEAMQIWSEHTTDIKLLLTDIRMPHGMSGYDVAENLLALNPDLKIIFTSGYSCESTRHDQILRQGALFLAKPCLPATLNEAVEKMVAAAQN